MALSIKVEGRVQGVFFRASTKEAADRLGIKGWVRNELDGAVLIWAEGEENELKQFVEWVSNGPPHASVDQLTTRHEEDAQHQDFRITYR